LKFICFPKRPVQASQDADNEHHEKNQLLGAAIIGLLGDCYTSPHDGIVADKLVYKIS
jgi:hypothetical protein